MERDSVSKIILGIVICIILVIITINVYYDNIMSSSYAKVLFNTIIISPVILTLWVLNKYEKEYLILNQRKKGKGRTDSFSSNASDTESLDEQQRNELGLSMLDDFPEPSEYYVESSTNDNYIESQETPKVVNKYIERYEIQSARKEIIKKAAFKEGIKNIQVIENINPLDSSNWIPISVNKGQQNCGIYIHKTDPTRLLKCEYSSGVPPSFIFSQYINSKLGKNIFPKIYTIYNKDNNSFIEMERLDGDLSDILFKIVPKKVAIKMKREGIIDDSQVDNLLFIFNKKVPITNHYKNMIIRKDDINRFNFSSSTYKLFLDRFKLAFVTELNESFTPKIHSLLDDLNSIGWDYDDTKFDNYGFKGDVIYCIDPPSGLALLNPLDEPIKTKLPIISYGFNGGHNLQNNGLQGKAKFEDDSILNTLSLEKAEDIKKIVEMI